MCSIVRNLSSAKFAQGIRVSQHRDCQSSFCLLKGRADTSKLFKKYGNYQQGTEPWKKYGRVNDWNIDLVPKLLMSNGELTNILVSTDVTRYLEFRQIAGSYVQQGNGARATVAKVPSDAGEALRSPLMGLFEKRRAKKFLDWVGAFDENNPASYGGKRYLTFCKLWLSCGFRLESEQVYYEGSV